MSSEEEYVHIGTHAEDTFEGAGKLPTVHPKKKGPRPKYDPEPAEHEWLKQHVMIMTDANLAIAVSQEFGHPVEKKDIARWRKRYGIVRPTGKHKGTAAIQKIVEDSKPDREAVIRPSTKEQLEKEADEHIRVAIMSGKIPKDMTHIPPISRDRLQRLKAYMQLPKFRLTLRDLEEGDDPYEKDYFLSEFANLTWDIEALDTAEMNRLIDLIMVGIEESRLRRAERNALKEVQGPAAGIVRQEYVRFYKDLDDRKKTITEQLRMTRAQRLKDNAPRGVSFLDLVAGWMDPARRLHMIRHAKKSAVEREKAVRDLEDKTAEDPRTVILGYRTGREDESADDRTLRQEMGEVRDDDQSGRDEEI